MLATTPLFLLFLGTQGIPTTKASQGFISKVDSAVQETMRKQNLVGLSVALFRKGTMVYLKGFGFADRKHKIPADGRTKYRWASISKPITAIAAMQLVEQKKLDLDEEIRSYVPEFPKKPWPISMRLLLAHQGGIVHYRNGKVIRSKRVYPESHPFTNLVQALDTFKESPLIAEPGTKYSYSTHGFILAGAVIRKAGGKPYWEQVRSRIKTPLGMSSFEPDYQWKNIEGRAVGYRRMGKKGVPFHSSNTDVSWKLPGGGFLSNVEDLARFGAAWGSPALLKKESWKTLWTPVPLKNGKKPSYGLGFALSRFAGKILVEHAGAQEKARTWLAALPGERTGVAIMSNCEYAKLKPLSRALLRILFDGKEVQGPGRLLGQLLGRLRSDVRRLAAPDWEGREAGTQGGRKAGDWLLTKMKDMGLQPGVKAKDGLSYVHGFRFGRAHCRNLVGILPGNKDARDYVLVGAHYDHLGKRGKVYFPGADDNASGVATTLALAAHFAKKKGKFPFHMVFVFFDAEEKGLIGSRRFVAHEVIPTQKIRFALIFDLVGGNFLPWRKGDIFVLGSEYSPPLEQMLEEVKKDFAKEPFRIVPLGNYILEPFGPSLARSDYMSFRAKKVPYLFVSSATPWYYHRPTDQPDRLDYAKMARVVRLSAKMLEGVLNRKEALPFVPRPPAKLEDASRMREILKECLKHREFKNFARANASFAAMLSQVDQIVKKGKVDKKDRRVLQRALVLLFQTVGK
jgi:CubicO group peptidase (beta-lactamase class C family)